MCMDRKGVGTPSDGMRGKVTDKESNCNNALYDSTNARCGPERMEMP
jgi:hypothetical protein